MRREIDQRGRWHLAFVIADVGREKIRHHHGHGHYLFHWIGRLVCLTRGDWIESMLAFKGMGGRER